MSSRAKLTFLGTGTSLGIPWVACDCHVCSSKDPLDFKTRCSSIIEAADGSNILIDCGPEFRLQCLREKIDHIDNIIFTHSHCDHILGITDLKLYTTNGAINAYANQKTIDDIRFRHPIYFGEFAHTKPPILFHPITTQSFDLGPFHIIPIPIVHNDLSIYGYRIGNFAYITDASFIPESSYELLHGVENLVINGLGRQPHKAHFSFYQTLDAIAKIRPKSAHIIHVTHDLTHQEMEEFFTDERAKRSDIASIEIHPAFDGETIDNICL